MTFSFDAAHHWMPVEPLLTYLSSEHDRDVLRSDLFGGRLSRPAIAVERLHLAAQAPGLIETPREWATMTDVAQRHLVDDTRECSYQTFADLVDVILDALQPSAMEVEETWVEVAQLDARGLVRPYAADWAHAYFENFMQYADGVVDSVVFTYPGTGYAAYLRFVVEGEEKSYALTFPATDTVADLIDHHYEFHDARHPTPVMDMLNNLTEHDIDALLDIANRTDVEFTDSVCVTAAPASRRDD